jgi:Zn-dependent alcohol dehydrogenase
MLAAILTQTRAPLEIAELRMPERLSFGQVHVRIHYSGICGAQLNEIEAAKGEDKFLPHLLGHEGSGTVVAVGEGVKRVKAGDRVVLHWRQSAGLQCEPPKYNWNGKTVNAGWVTTFNDEAIISENRLTVIPPDFPLHLAPLFGCAVTTAVGVVNNDAQIKIGQSVVIFGVGGVGLNIAQAAQMVSANPIVGVDLLDSKLTMAREWGITHAFNSRTEGDALAAKIREIVGAGGADVVVDTTGNATSSRRPTISPMRMVAPSSSAFLAKATTPQSTRYRSTSKKSSKARTAAVFLQISKSPASSSSLRKTKCASKASSPIPFPCTRSTKPLPPSAPVKPPASCSACGKSDRKK